MKGYAMLKIGESAWIEKERPKCGPMDAICRPLAVAICTSDVHTLWEGAIGDRHNMILGHECCAEVVEVGELVKDFQPGDRVLVPAITPDWNSLEAQAGYSMHSGGMLAGWKFSNFKDGVFSDYFHVNDADGNAYYPDVKDNAVVLLHAGDSDPDHHYEPFNGAKSIAAAANGANGVIFDSIGKIYAWGDNTRGQIGDGTQDNREISGGCTYRRWRSLY